MFRSHRLQADESIDGENRFRENAIVKNSAVQLPPGKAKQNNHEKIVHGNAGKDSKSSEQLGILARQPWKPFIDKHDYPYLLNNPFKCFNKKTRLFEELTLIAVIASHPAHTERRNVIRMTWIRHAIEKRFSIKVVFMLGMASDRATRTRIKHEAVLYNDIVQEAFQDSYLNLTVKTIGALKWATRSCPHAKFFMKLDDDVVLNVGNVTGFLQFMKVSSGYLGGIVQAETAASRDPENKWYVPEDIYPLDTYPAYPEGKAYIMSMDVAKKILLLSRETQIFPWEDTFIGLCAERLKIVPQDITNFYGVGSVLDPKVGIMKTEEALRKLNILYLVYDLDVGQMIEIWQAWMRNSWD